MRKRSIAAVAAGAVTVVALAVVGVIFFLRHQILQYSADAIVRKLLPAYIEVDRVTFDPGASRLVLNGFRIQNPPGFSHRYLLEVDEIVTAYRLKGKSVLDGIVVLEPVFRRPVMTIERLEDGTLNLMRMPAFIRETADRQAGAQPKAEQRHAAKGDGKADAGVKALIGDRTVADIVTIPEAFSVKEGRLVFSDRKGFSRPYVTSIDRIEAQLSLKLDASYSNVLKAGSEGQGILNGKGGQIIVWNSAYDPTTPRLTMANRFDITGADIMPLKPYYDAFSPIDFHRGNFSGALVLDFDNGSIGATAEVRLENLAFTVKETAANASALWDAPADEIAKYFTGPSGEVIFDFKIKGDMSKPRFLLGPISRQAVTSMAIDKVAPIVINKIFSQTKDTAGAAVDAAVPDKSDAEKAAQIIGAISDFMKKQNKE